MGGHRPQPVGFRRGRDSRTYLRTLEAREGQERPEEFDLDEALERATREPRTKPGDLWASVSIASSAATRPSPATADSSLVRRRRCSSPTRPGTWPSAATPIPAIVSAAVLPTTTSPRGVQGFPAWFAAAQSPMSAAMPMSSSAPRAGRRSMPCSATPASTGRHDHLGQGHLRPRTEPLPAAIRAHLVWLARRGTSSFGGRRDLDDVWELARPSGARTHPTTKPVELVERAIEASSTAGDRVLDPFGARARRSSPPSAPAGWARSSSSTPCTATSSSRAGRPSPGRWRGARSHDAERGRGLAEVSHGIDG